MKNSILYKGREAFTLLESLAVIAIIMIVASLLLTAITSSFEKSRQAICINNQHQLVSAVILFALDEEKFPTQLADLRGRYLEDGTQTGDGTAYAAIGDYYQNNTEILRCPKVGGTQFDNPPVYSYGMNAMIQDMSYHALDSPSEVVMIADSDQPLFETLDQTAPRHLGKAVAGFADGHVEWLRDFVPLSVDSGPIFTIDGGGVILNEVLIPSVHFLTAQITYGGWYWDCNGRGRCRPNYYLDWMDMFLDLEVTSPGGETSLYHVTDPEGGGVDGAMTDENLNALNWESPDELESGSEINAVAMARWWRPNYRRNARGQWETYWTYETYVSYNTRDESDSQVWVLKNGDPVPDVPGFYNAFTDQDQTSVAEAIAPYTRTDENGDMYVSLTESQAIYFFELSHTNPVLPDGSVNRRFDMNDLVFFMDLQPTPTSGS